MHKVDCRGMLCPAPLIKVKQALKESQSIEVLIDNETSFLNVSRYLTDNNIIFTPVSKNNSHIIYVNAVPHEGNGEMSQAVVGTVILIGSNSMGQGSDELGQILIKGYISTLSELNTLPSEIIFYNSGVLLTVNDSPAKKSLCDLEKLGVKITICGTCVDYYNVKSSIEIGTISNMYSISESLAAASKIIRL